MPAEHDLAFVLGAVVAGLGFVLFSHNLKFNINHILGHRGGKRALLYFLMMIVGAVLMVLSAPLLVIDYVMIHFFHGGI